MKTVNKHHAYWLLRAERNRHRDAFELANSGMAANRIHREQIKPRDEVLSAYEAEYPEVRVDVPFPYSK